MPLPCVMKKTRFVWVTVYNWLQKSHTQENDKGVSNKRTYFSARQLSRQLLKAQLLIVQLLKVQLQEVQLLIVQLLMVQLLNVQLLKVSTAGGNSKYTNIE